MTPEQGLATWAALPIGIVPIRFRQDQMLCLGGYKFDADLTSDTLIYCTEADITLDHICVDGGRIYFMHFADGGRAWRAGDPRSPIRQQWVDLINRCSPTIANSRAGAPDQYGEAFGTCCAGFFGDINLSGSYISPAAQQEVKAFILRIGDDTMPKYLSGAVAVQTDALGNADVYGQRIPAATFAAGKPAFAVVQRIGLAGSEASLPNVVGAAGEDASGFYWTGHVRGDPVRSGTIYLQAMVLQ